MSGIKHVRRLLPDIDDLDHRLVTNVDVSAHLVVSNVYPALPGILLWHGLNHVSGKFNLALAGTRHGGCEQQNYQ
jgi:hypothetical protein